MQDRINQVEETSCTARPDHTLGSNSLIRRYRLSVRFARKRHEAARASRPGMHRAPIRLDSRPLCLAGAMKRYRSPSKKKSTLPSSATLLRRRAEYLGIVEALDERSAESAAVREFKLSNEDRRRLTLRARA
jgi:hypothetical protein